MRPALNGELNTDAGERHDLAKNADTLDRGETNDNDGHDSLHPAQVGSDVIRMVSTTDRDSLLQDVVINPNETVTVSFQVPADAPGAGFSTSWSSGDVAMSLRSPSGRVLTRTSTAADVVHQVAPTQELLHVKNPEPGEWTIRMYGADVAGSGESVTLSAHAAEPVNNEPVAAFELTQTGPTVTVDGRASSDPGGSVLRYIWEFDDGRVLEGPVVSHRYTKPGEYLVTLTVVNDREAVDGAAAEGTVTISRYDFTGFDGPVGRAPMVNLVEAGRSLPLKFGLGGDQGRHILAEASPRSRRIDCDSAAEVTDVSAATTAGSSSLQYDSLTERYTYVWKTNPAWAGQCRLLSLALDDGSSATLRFRFR